jgi:hypothetical protein
MSLEEMRSGLAKPNKDLPFREALKDFDTRAEYIRRKEIFFKLVSNLNFRQIYRSFSGGRKTLSQLSPILPLRFPMACAFWLVKLLPL